MLHTISFTKTRLVLLVISITSLFAFMTPSFAQEEQSVDEGMGIVSAHLTSFEDNTLNIDFSIQNYDSQPSAEVYYGIEITTFSERGAGEIIAASKIDGPFILEPNSGADISFAYQIPTIPNGTYDFNLIVVDATGEKLAVGHVTTQTLQGNLLDIEIHSNTCEYAADDKTRMHISETFTLEKGEALTVLCDVTNNTETEQTLYETATVLDSLYGEAMDEVVGTRVVALPPGEETQVAFNFPTPTSDGSYALRFRLINETVASNDILTPQLVIVEPTSSHTATNSEQNTVFVIIITLLALVVLLAVLVYMRKSKESLSEMHYPEK